MIKRTIVFIILILSTTINAQETVQKIVLKFGKHHNFYRFVFICESPELTHSISVNLLKDGKIKLILPAIFELEFEGRVLTEKDYIKELKIEKKNKVLIIGTSNIKEIKVSRYESLQKLVIDAYFEKTKEEKNFKHISVLIDPGHGGKETGIKNEENNEKTVTLSVAKEIASRLIQKKIKASLTRATDEDLSIRKRVKIENSLNPSLFVSIHLSSENYFIVYTSPLKKNISPDNQSKTFFNEDSAVKLFIQKLKERFSEPVYIEKLPLTLLKESSSPALMIEIPKKTLISDKIYINEIIDVFVQAITQNFKIKDKK